MKVTLTFPYGAHKAESTVDLDDSEAKTLLREGNARAADAASREVVAAEVAPDSAQEPKTTSRTVRRNTEQKG